MVMSIAAIGAVAGPPISGAINEATGGYNAVGYYAGKGTINPFRLRLTRRRLGSMILLAVALIMTTRHLVLGRLIGKF